MARIWRYESNYIGDINMLHHIGIYVSDIRRSRTFYETILPIQTKEALKWNQTELIFFKGEGFMLELIPDTFTNSETTHIAFAVEDVDTKINELKQNGITPSEGPYTLDNGWHTVFYEGPDGEEIEFIQSNN
jgi:lactoylglutathione lyase